MINKDIYAGLTVIYEDEDLTECDCAMTDDLTGLPVGDPNCAVCHGSGVVPID